MFFRSNDVAVTVKGSLKPFVVFCCDKTWVYEMLKVDQTRFPVLSIKVASQILVCFTFKSDKSDR